MTAYAAFYYPRIVDKLRFFAECLPPDGYRPFTSVIIANTRDFSLSFKDNNRIYLFKGFYKSFYRYFLILWNVYNFCVLFLVVLHNMWIIMWIMFRYCYMYYCIIILIQKSALIVQTQNQNIRSILGKMGKNRRIKSGGTKNPNKRSVFPAAYKLVHLYTNFIFKPLNKNYIKPSKIKHFTNLSSQI